MAQELAVVARFYHVNFVGARCLICQGYGLLNIPAIEQGERASTVNIGVMAVGELEAGRFSVRVLCPACVGSSMDKALMLEGLRGFFPV